MSDSASVTASSLAIAEKRPRKSGGCVGIFFQLFDWNRRFAKKKLFSKRLLPPDRTKESSKKFGGDEKLPKLRLIADENSGGFPNPNKNGVSTVTNNSVVKNGGAQTPSLVARLMGLESMPSVHREKLQKESSGEIWGGRREKVVDDCDEFQKETTRQEFRPQKLQKTGMVERRSVSRFGAEALQLKNVLSRSRKHHHHPKLASPVKNSSNQSRRNTSRLIGAATRILEPGLQSRARSKYAITYARSSRRPPGNVLRKESIDGELLHSSSGQASCKNCGSLLDIAESTSKRDNHNHNHSHNHKLVQMSPNGKSRYDSKSFDEEQEFVPIDHVRQKSTSPSNMKENSRNFFDVSVSEGVSSNQLKSNCLPFSRMVASSTDAVTDTKDFVALNRNLSGRTQSRVPPKVEKRIKFESGREVCSSSGQKRQLTHGRKQGERMVSNATFSGKQIRPNACSVDRVCIERQPDYQGQSSKLGIGGNKNSDGMAFRFSSVTKNRCEVPAKFERRRNQNGMTYPCTTTSRKNCISNQSEEKTCLQKPLPLTGSSLGAILEEKLKELANQVGYESGINGTPLKGRTSANIFQDLICALDRERSVSQKVMDFRPQRSHFSECCNHRYDHNASFCSKTRSEKAGSLVGYKNIDHLSPGSVLESSFSNDSCCSSSLDDSAGRTQHADSMSYSYDESKSFESENDPFYSGVSLIKDICSKFVADLLTNISEALCRIGLLNSKIKGNTLAYSKEVIFNAELVLHNPNKIDSFFICYLLLELDTISEVMRKRFGNFLESGNSNKGYQMKRFTFDCLVEYLDSKYCQYSRCGFRAWMNHPAFMGSEILVREVIEEVRRWMGFDGETTDDLVERDMSHSLGKWTDFEVEAYEAGAKIELDVLQMLVDELVVDLTTGMGCLGC